MLTCCSLPRVSVKRRSAHLTSFSLIKDSTSRELISPPVVGFLLGWASYGCSQCAKPMEIQIHSKSLRLQNAPSIGGAFLPHYSASDISSLYDGASHCGNAPPR